MSYEKIQVCPVKNYRCSQHCEEELQVCPVNWCKLLFDHLTGVSCGPAQHCEEELQVCPVHRFMLRSFCRVSTGLQHTAGANYRCVLCNVDHVLIAVIR